MKKDKNKKRFHIFDYLWWQGEMLGRLYTRAGRHPDGHYMVGLYGLTLLAVTLIVPCTKILPSLALYALLVVIVFLGDIWLSRIYRTRGVAVMKHFANRKFHPIIGILLFIFPLVILCALMFFLMSNR